MHEMSIAAGLMEKLLEFAHANPDKLLIEIRICIGELTHIDPEQLRFAYQAITEQTELEGSTLDIKAVKALVQCSHCSYLGEPKYWEDALSFTSIVTLQCPRCGKSTEAVQGHECAITSVKYREEAMI